MVVARKRPSQSPVLSMDLVAEGEARRQEEHQRDVEEEEAETSDVEAVGLCGGGQRAEEDRHREQSRAVDQVDRVHEEVARHVPPQILWAVEAVQPDDAQAASVWHSTAALCGADCRVRGDSSHTKQQQQQQQESQLVGKDPVFAVAGKMGQDTPQRGVAARSAA